MASINKLFDSCDRNSKEFELLAHDLLVNNSDVPFDNREVEVAQNTIVTSINSRINLASTRYSGLVMLDETLSGCSKNILSKYAILWITKSTEILQDIHSTTQDIRLACKVLGFLLVHCKEISELHKQISMQNIKQLVFVVNNLMSNEECSAIYYLIAVMLYHYPEVCERSQEFIKKMILLHIDSTQENLINASAKCFVLLSKGTERSFKPPATKSIYTRWTYNQALLCNSLHMIMNDLFSGLIELKTVDIWDKLDLSPISKDNVIKYYNIQKQRFSNLCIYLSSMLCGYHEKNSVVPHDILGILCRGLAITPLNLKDKNSLEEQMLYIILPKLHIGLLTVLNALINGFSKELIPLGKTILNLLQQMLLWTNTVLENHLTFKNNKSFKNVKISTYKCLSSWLRNTNTLSGIEKIANECLTIIMEDIMPERDCLQLTVQKSQHWSKRVMKRFKDSQYENSSILNKRKIESGSLDADLCKEALITLQNILHCGGILLKQIFYRNVQNIVVPLLYKFYLNHSAQSFYKKHNKCRLELFRVLRSLQMNPHSTLVSPIQYYLEISHKATNDVDLNIAQEARFALIELEKIIHPIAPTLQFPLQNNPDNEVVSENRVEETSNITTVAINSDKRNRIEEELSKEADAMSSAYKRPKIIPEHTRTIEDKNNTKPIEIDDNETNFNEFQTNLDLRENVRNSLDESDTMHYNNRQSSLNSESTSVNTETAIASEIVTHITTENNEQLVDLSLEDKTDEILRNGSSPITEQISKRPAEEKVHQKEDFSDDSEIFNMFSDIT